MYRPRLPSTNTSPKQQTLSKETLQIVATGAGRKKAGFYTVLPTGSKIEEIVVVYTNSKDEVDVKVEFFVDLSII